MMMMFLESCTALFWLFFADAPGIVRADSERFPRHAAQASRPLPRSRKAVHIPGLIPRRATSRMGLNATPRARTFVGIAVHWPAVSVGREAVVVRISV